MEHERPPRICQDPGGMTDQEGVDMSERTCIIPGCDKPSRSSNADWCKKHYHRWYRNGSPLTLRGHRPPTDLIGQRFGALTVLRWELSRWVCVCDCGTETRVPAGGLNRGSTQSCGNRAHARLPEVMYNAAHQRLRVARGNARQYGCISCDALASHWAYDHADPNELTSPQGAYSLNVDHYNPQCVPCHKAFDLRVIKAKQMNY